MDGGVLADRSLVAKQFITVLDQEETSDGLRFQRYIKAGHLSRVISFVDLVKT